MSMDEPFEVVIPVAPEDEPFPQERGRPSLPPPASLPPRVSPSPLPRGGSNGGAPVLAQDALAEEDGFTVCMLCNVKFPDSSKTLHDWHSQVCQEVTAQGLPAHSFSRNYSCDSCQLSTTSSKVHLLHSVDVHKESWKVFACNLCEYASRWKCKVIRHRRMIHGLNDPKFEPYQCRVGAVKGSDKPLPPPHKDMEKPSWKAPMPSNPPARDPTTPSGASSSPLKAESSPKQPEEGARRRKPQVVRKIPRSHERDAYPDEVGPRVEDQSDSEEYYSDRELEEHHHRRLQKYHEQVAQSLEQRAGPAHQNHRARPSTSDPTPNYSRGHTGGGDGPPRKGLEADGLRATPVSGDVLNELDDSQPALVMDVDESPRDGGPEDTLPTFRAPNQPPGLSHGGGGVGGPMEGEDQVDEISINGEILFRCKLCPFTNKNRWKTLKHAKSIHTNTRAYDCKECSFHTNSRVDYYTHKAYHSPKGTVRCSECNYTTSSKTNMERHRENHRRNLPVKCLYCTFSSTGEAAIQRHMAECHNLEECGQAGGDGQEDREHAGMMGEGDEDTLDRSGGGMSMSRDHDSALGMMASGRDAQRDSLSRSGSASSLRRPSSAMSSEYEGDRMGPDGDSQSSTPSLLSGAWEGLKCLTCLYMAKCPSDKMRHNRVHSSDKMFECTVCHKKYKYRGDLNVHIRRAHPGTRPYAVPSHRQPSGRAGPPTMVNTNRTPDSGQRAPGRSRADMFGYGKSPRLHPSANSGRAGVSMPQRGDLPTMVPLNNRRGLASQSPSPSRPSPKMSLSGSGPTNNWRNNNAGSSSAGFGRSEPGPSGMVPQGSGTSGQPTPCKCPACPYQTQERKHMEAHILARHMGYPAYACAFCEYQTAFRDWAAEHVVRLHKHKLQPGGATPLMDQAARLLQRARLGYPRGNMDTAASGDNSSTSGDRPSQEKCTYGCTTCDFSSTDLIEFKSHLGEHEGLKLFQCGECGKRSNWKWDIQRHIKKEHGRENVRVRTLSYEEGKATIKEYERFRQSLMTQKRQILPTGGRATQKYNHGGLRPFKCSACDKRSNWKCDVKKHIRNVHNNNSRVYVITLTSAQLGTSGPVTSAGARAAFKKRSAEDYWASRPYKCSLCSRRSNWSWDIRKHMRTMHKGVEGRVIRDAMPVPKVGTAGSAMPLKTKVGHTGKGSPAQLFKKSGQGNTPGSFQCSACRQFSEFQWVIKRHIKSVHGEGKAVVRDLSKRSGGGDSRPFICSLCAKRSNWKWDVKKHILTVHKGKTGSIYDETSYKETVIHPSGASTDLAGNAANKIKAMLGALEASNSSAAKAVNNGDSHSEGGHSLRGARPAKPLSVVHRYKCSYCLYKCEQRAEMLTHIKRSHPRSYVRYSSLAASALHGDGQGKSKGVWKCTHCSYSNSNGDRVLTHIQDHGMFNRFNCVLCDFTHELSHSMVEHLRTKHDSADPALIQCNVVYQEAGQDNNGLVEEGDEAEMDDDGVPESPTASRGSSSSSKQSKSVFRCRLCDMSTSWRSAIVRHLKDKHKGAARTPANYYISESNEDMPHVPSLPPQRLQRPSTSSLPAPAVTDKRYQCETCPFQTDKVATFHEHQERHREVPGHFKCPHCDYWVSVSRLLKQHVRLHMAAGEECAEEDGGSEDNRSLLRGQYTMDGKAFRPRRFKCKECPYMSKTKPDLLYHKQLHRPRNSAPHKCPKCRYWVSAKGVLSQHMKVHTASYQRQIREEIAMLAQHQYSSAGPLGNGSNRLQSGRAKTTGSRPLAPLSYQVEARREAQEDMEDISEQALNKTRIVNSKTEPVVLNSRAASMTVGEIHKQIQVGGLGSVRKLYRCTMCPYANTRASRLVQHEKYHVPKEGNDLKCTECSFACNSRTSMGHHHKVHSEQYEGDLLDDEEDGQEAENNANGESQETVTEQEPRRPVSEGTIVSSEGGFVVRQDQATGERVLDRDAERKRYACEKCPYATGRKEHYIRHTGLHGSQQKYKCQYCDYSVPISNLLDRHALLHSRPNTNLLYGQSVSNLQAMPSRPADRELKETPVARVNTPSGPANVVVDNHDHLELYECRDNFPAELVAAEGGLLYSCDRCPFSSKLKQKLLEHMKFHLTPDEFKCPICDYSQPTKAGIQDHIKDHFGGRNPPSIPDWPSVRTAEHNTGPPERKLMGLTYVEPAEGEVETYQLDEFDPEVYERERAELEARKKEMRDKGLHVCDYCDLVIESRREYEAHVRLHFPGEVPPKVIP